ncbi:MAG: cofactor-independent phosphoglycerate mutase [Candidatus Dadabacteria bacterium]|nr:MAG: cofactor-independent phosphoglycerate mutase [Candidatus Dadabacteria bacterium]
MTRWYFLQPDGASDEPQDALNGQTPLQAAHTPALDQLARRGSGIRLRTIPEGFPPGSDVGNLSLLGYDPNRYFTGRSPIEAAAMGIELGSGDVAFRCNLVTISEQDGARSMVDFSAGHIATVEAHELIDALNEALPDVSFYPGVSYRHIVVAQVPVEDLRTTPPHDIQGQRIDDWLPSGAAASWCRDVMERAHAVLADHPVNQRRTAEGKLPATDIWLWGQGGATRLMAFRERHGWSGAMITAVDLLRGLGVLSGMRVIEVEGATGFVDTNYAGKARAAIESDEDFVFVHLEAPDESSHMGSLKHKLESIERFDAEILAPIAEVAEAEGAGIIVAPDHPTLLRTRTHALADVPCVVWNPRKPGDGAEGFDERLLSRNERINGWELLDVVRERYSAD